MKNDDLMRLQEQVERKKALEKRKETLADRKRFLFSEECRLAAVRQKEDEDVEKWENGSLAAFFYSIIGKKEERLEKLMALQAKISRERNQLRIGKEEKMLVTGWQDGTYTARSQWEAPDADGEILLLCDRELIPGSFVKGRIIAADVYDLTAKAE